MSNAIYLIVSLRNSSRDINCNKQPPHHISVNNVNVQCALYHIHATVFLCARTQTTMEFDLVDLWREKNNQTRKMQLLCYVCFALWTEIEKKELINHRIFIYFLTFLFIDLHRSVRRETNSATQRVSKTEIMNEWMKRKEHRHS